MFSKLLKDPSNGIEIIEFIGVDQDIIQIDDNENIELLNQNLIDVALKTR